MKWYVVHTYASHEFRIKELIEKGIKGTDLEGKIGRILVPTQETFIIRDGKKVPRQRKIFNSYIIIEVELTPDVKKHILDIPGVTNFLGAAKSPHSLSAIEVDKLLGISDRDKTSVKNYRFIPGDMVKITAGPFTDFEGSIEHIDEEAKKITVKVTVFGRITPIEVNLDQIEII